jgi:hypothetical protein
MDYKAVHNDLIMKIKSENRTKKSGIYYEKHHIIPDFFFKNRKRKGPKGYLPGDPNYSNNLVLVTPKEHYLLHLLLYKIYKDTRYSHSCLSSLFFLCGEFKNENSDLSINRNKFLKSMNSRKCEKIRSKYAVEVSKQHKGKIPVKDSITGEMIGQVSTNHPKVLSGEWVHHTKGRVKPEEEKIAHSKKMTGLKNSNSKGYTDEQLLNSYLNCCKKFGFIVGNGLWIKFSEKYNTEYIKHFKEFRFDGGGFVKMREIAEKILNIKYDSKLYIKSSTKKFYYEQVEKWL